MQTCSYVLYCRSVTNLVRVQGLWDDAKRDLTNESYDSVHVNRYQSTHVNRFVLHCIKTVTSIGGYVAGGMARYLAARKLFDRSVSTQYKPGQHKYVNQSFDKDFFNYINYGGDVDFFFKTKESYEVALAMLRLEILTLSKFDKEYEFMTVSEMPSMCNNATNMIVNLMESQIKFQFIKRQFCDVETMLEDFDMTNSKVAIVGDDIVMHKDWYDVEKIRAIDVRKTNSAFCIGRIKKYMSKYIYTSLTSESRRILINNIQAMDEIVTSSLLQSTINNLGGPRTMSTKQHYIPGYDSKQHRNNLQQIIKLFSDDDIKKIVEYYEFLPKDDKLMTECMNRLTVGNSKLYGMKSTTSRLICSDSTDDAFFELIFKTS